MEISVVSPAALTADDLQAWRAMQQASPNLDNPFLSSEFARAVGAVKANAAVAIMRVGGQPVGYLPFERGGLGLGRAIGAGVSDGQGVVCLPGVSWDPSELLRACHLAVLEFDHLVDGQQPFAPYVTRSEPSAVMDISDGFEAYMERLGRSKSVSRTLAKQRALERDVGALRFELDSSSDSAFRALLLWKSAQYRRTGRPDLFRKQWIVELLRALTSTKGESLTGLLSVLWAGERPVAVHACLVSTSTLSMWFPAYDRDLSKYSPGMILRLRIAQAAARLGLDQIDIGKGSGEHKEHLQTGALTVSEARVALRSPLAAVHRLYREPPRRFERFVLDHRHLRVAARRARQRIGTARSRLSR